MRLISFVLLLISFHANAGVFLFDRTQQAAGVPYDNSVSLFPSNPTDVQAAIEASRLYADTVSRYTINAGFDGTASTGRWLEFHSNVASNATGHAPPRNASLKELSFVCSASSTSTLTVFKNGVSLTTISITAQKKSNVTGLSLALVPTDELSVQTTSGSCAKPILYLFIVFT
jgi:hypothetical protein